MQHVHDTINKEKHTPLNYAEIMQIVTQRERTLDRGPSFLRSYFSAQRALLLPPSQRHEPGKTRPRSITNRMCFYARQKLPYLAD